MSDKKHEKTTVFILYHVNEEKIQMKHPYIKQNSKQDMIRINEIHTHIWTFWEIYIISGKYWRNYTYWYSFRISATCTRIDD